MSANFPWEQSYPQALRQYQLNPERLMRSVDQLAGEGRRRFGDALAVTVVLPDGAEQSLSFAQIDQLSDDFAAYLVSTLGLQPGEVLAIQLPNCLHYPIAAFGAWKAGLILTNVNPLYTPTEVRHQLSDSGAKALVACDLFIKTIAEAGVLDAGLPLLLASMQDFFRPADQVQLQNAPAGSVSLMAALAKGATLPRVQVEPVATALYQYTGGTTGRSKGAVLTHANLCATMVMMDDFMSAYGDGFTVEDCIITVIPLYHIFAFTINFLAFYRAGARNLFIPSPRPMANLRPAFDNHQVTWMTGVDTLYAGLLAEDWFQANPPKLKRAISGGTALRPSTAERWNATVCRLLEGFGMTESTCIGSCHPPQGEHRMGWVGLPMPGCEIRMVDDAGVAVAPGVAGELVMKGPHMISGYLNRPDEQGQSFRDGWFYTGDVGVMDETGFIQIVDRKKDLVIVSGFNVYPNEVEAVLAEHPGVLEVAVIGVKDEHTGEAVRAVVARRDPQLSAEDLIAHCRQHLTGYKVPKQVVFMEQLPKSTVGKILRAELRKQA
jgi:long-chain acyl-CoA synthetase